MKYELSIPSLCIQGAFLQAVLYKNIHGILFYYPLAELEKGENSSCAALAC